MKVDSKPTNFPFTECLKKFENKSKPSMLFGSINPYSYLGHSQRMFSIAQYLAKRGVRVAWINSPSFTCWQNSKLLPPLKISKKIDPLFLVSKDEIGKNASITVYDSWATPKYDKNPVSFYFTRLLEKIYSKVFVKFHQFDVFFFDSPIFVPLAAELKKQNTLIIYDCPDDYSVYSELVASFKQAERTAFKVTDIATTPAQSIRKSLLSRNKDLVVFVVPNGVPEGEIRSPQFRDLNVYPRIGFVGTLASWVDVELVFEVANKMPKCEFIIVGDGPDFRYWKQKTPLNCKLLGRVPIARRGDFISSFDVGLIPFKEIPLTHSAFPLKLLEYFARGVPVVSSPLLEIENIASGFVHFASGVDDWVSQINNALNDSAEDRLLYVKFASKFTWEHSAELLFDLVCDVLHLGKSSISEL